MTTSPSSNTTSIPVPLLKGLALRWAITKAVLGPDKTADDVEHILRGRHKAALAEVTWDFAGYCLEEKNINLAVANDGPAVPKRWVASCHTQDRGTFLQFGETPRLAIARCFVHINLGWSVDVPVKWSSL